MFTGITEETGKIKSISKQSVTIICQEVLKNTAIGDSIAVNGVCLTVTDLFENGFSFDISSSTFSVTNLSELKQGTEVNLERAVKSDGRFGGHYVSGHIDSVAKVLYVKNLTSFKEIAIKIPNELKKYVIKRGSIAVNGVSLTVSDIDNTTVTIMLIPHTIRNTNLLNLKSDDIVNIETDILAKYTEKLLSGTNKTESSITTELLAQNGFI